MNAARIFSTRSLQTICLMLLLGIAAHSLTPANADPPADPSAAATANKDFAGTWRGKINGADLVWITDGRTWSTYIEGQPRPFITGTFEAANGHWKTNTAAGPLDEGPFHFIDADTISMTGRAGQEVIWKRKSSSGQCDADEGNPALRPNDSAVRSNDAGHHGESAVCIGDFGQRSCQAGRPGRFRGTSQASPCGRCRLEFCGGAVSRRLVGRYGGSRMRPIGARFLFFSPAGARNGAQETGLRFGSSTTRSTPAPIVSKLPRRRSPFPKQSFHPMRRSAVFGTWPRLSIPTRCICN